MGEDTGETSQSYLEKITPKDLVMFSPTSRKVIAKNDFNYLDVDYDLQLPDQQQMDNIRVWGLPQLRLFDPIPLGLFIGFGGASLFNFWRRRPALTSIQLHLVSSLAVAGLAKLGYAKFEDYRTQRELVVWDYVKKHPQDFPEVFNPPKKYKDLLLSWKPVR
ncbi:NADH dehydrogenase [ubiquinone] 1 subunit C2 [Brachionus plicatilis]|uniref:NADH dehydrogenase [ubiquinone] 1 subunit C2 n=1 Tax=Brachionus plicatilis TaxID=10195 RepID=A0A3M7QLC0_BRAPC|nr:NADH dehydrogenase [ubiquinone] 1 subunit C2 [Brachionus plicatilis]